MKQLAAIVAYDKHYAIGKNGWLPWGSDLPTDLAHFRRYIADKTVIGGRDTIQPIAAHMRAARIIMLSAKAADMVFPPGIEGARSLAEAITMSGTAETVFIGGSFDRALPYLTKIIATEIDAAFDGCDTFFPALPESEWRRTHVEAPKLTLEDKYPFKIVTYERTA